MIVSGPRLIKRRVSRVDQPVKVKRAGTRRSRSGRGWDVGCAGWIPGICRAARTGRLGNLPPAIHPDIPDTGDPPVGYAEPNLDVIRDRPIIGRAVPGQVVDVREKGVRRCGFQRIEQWFMPT